MRSSSIDDELGVLLRAAEVVEAQLAHRDAVLQRPDDALVAAALCAAARFLRSSASRVRDLLLVHRLQKAIERGSSTAAAAGTARAADRAPACGSPRRAALIAGRAAHAGGDAAHLQAARVQPLEPRARVGGQALQHRHQRDRRRPTARPDLRRRPSPAWTFASIAARNAASRRGRRGRSARRPPRAAAGRRRAASTRRPPRRRGRTAGSTGTETLPSGSRPCRRRPGRRALDRSVAP